MAKRRPNAQARNTGDKLETLVHAIETHVAPSGFRVERRRREFLPSGVQFAEYDIYITGPSPDGSSTVTWLIECRDRPSEGRAPREWILELYGMKVADGFDKVFAVSTTGFAEPAQEAAEKLGIILRTVSDISDVANDFEAMSLKVASIDYGVRPLWSMEYTHRHPPAPRFEVPWNHLTMRLRVVGEPKFQDFATFIVHHTDRRCVNLDGDTPVQYLWGLSGKIEVLMGSDHFFLTNPHVPVEVKRIEHAATILTARQYTENERVIAQDGEFGVDTPSGFVRYRVRIIDRGNGDRDTIWEREQAPAGARPMPRTIITEKFSLES